MDSFAERLPALLREFAESVTSYTATELWCRISVAGWDTCWPALRRELDGSDSNVKCLVLDVLCEQCESMGPEYVEGYHGTIERLLSDGHPRTRMAAVLAVRQLFVRTPLASSTLREIACTDEPHLSAEAIVTLLELDPKVASEISSLLRESESWRATKTGDSCYP